VLFLSFPYRTDSIIVPLLSYDEPKVSLIQTTLSVRLSLTGHSDTDRGKIFWIDKLLEVANTSNLDEAGA